MLDRRAFLSLALVTLASGAALAAPVRSTPAGARGVAPSEHVAQIDGPVAVATGARLNSWAVWAYRSPGEFDLAVTSRSSTGEWSAPLYLGRRNGLDEVEPAIAVDVQGTVYIAFVTLETGRVSMAALPAGTTTWLGPVVVSGNDSGSTPSLAIFGDHVVVAYRTASGIGMADMPVLSPAVIMGIQDGPDGVDPIGMVPKWSGEKKKQEGSEQDPSLN